MAASHFRSAQSLVVSSIGLGTYLGPCDDPTDSQYREAIVRAVELGANLVDTAINYRCQRSERVIGQALRDLRKRGIDREEIVICSKAGFVPFDGKPVPDVAGHIQKDYIDPGILSAEDVVDGHSLSAPFLRDQIERSRKNLGVDRIDVYYLHNPEVELGALSRNDFNDRIDHAFEALEEAGAEGKIHYYGVATWDGFRREPDSEDYLSIEELVKRARAIGGDDHRFRFIQLPYNIDAPDAVAQRNQDVGGRSDAPLRAADELGLTVVTSASLAEGRLLGRLPRWLGGILSHASTDAQRAIQFLRSTPGVTTALVGMRHKEHVEENLALARIEPLEDEAFRRLVPEDAAQTPWLY